MLRRGSSSLIGQMLVVFVLAVALPVGLSLVEAQRARADAEAQATEDAGQGAQLAALQVSDILDDATTLARTLQQLPGFLDGDDAQRDRTLALFAASRPYFNGLVYFTPDLLEHGSSNHQPGTPRLDVSSRAYAREAVTTGNLALSAEPLQSLNTGEIVLPIAAPLHAVDASQPPTGFLAVGLKVNRLPAIWTGIPLPSGTTIMLVDVREGRVLTGNGDVAGIVGQTISAPNLEGILARQGGWITTTLRGSRTRLRQPAPVQGTPWTIAVDVPAEEIFGPVDADIWRRAVTAIAVGALTLLALGVLWLRLARRVTRLQTAAAHWTEGDWNFRTGLQGSDEFGRVARTPDIMADQRQRAEAALRESEERFRVLVEGVTDFAMILLSPGGHVSTWNTGAERLTGYSSEEILGQPLARLYTDEDRAEGVPRALLQQAEAAGRAQAIGWGVRADGRRFWADVVLTLLREADGATRGYAAVIRDVSARKRADEAQRDELRHLSEIIRTQGDVAQAELDPVGLMNLVVARLPELTEASGAVVELAEGEEMVYAAASGSAAGHVGMRLKKDSSFSGLCVRTEQVLISSDSEHDDRVDLAATRAIGVRSMVVAPLEHAGHTVGAVKLVSPRANAFDQRQIATLELMTGVLGGALGHAQAFAERTEAEAQALAAAQRLEEVLRAATEVAIIGVDLDLRIMLFNSGAERMLGYRADEMIGTSPIRLMDAEQFRTRAAERGVPVRDLFLAAARRGEAATDEWTFIRKDGSPLTVSMSVTGMHSPDGALVGYIGLADDITERKAIEEMKDQFVSIVAHELRTPMTSIRGSLGLLGGGLLGPLPDQAQRMLTIAVENSERLLRLINDILDLERMRSGRMQLETGEADLASLMTQSADVMRAMADAAGVHLQVRPLAVQICADSDRLIQVFTNLLSNAIKFSPPGSGVCLRARANGQGRVRIEVQDAGRGIPADKLGRVFDRFQQVNTADSRQKGGTGLGLAICKMIVQQHNGRIWAESTLGQGTTILVELPLLTRE